MVVSIMMKNNKHCIRYCTNHRDVYLKMNTEHAVTIPYGKSDSIGYRLGVKT